MILIDALYINIGGGKVLLEYLIETILNRALIKDFHLLVDDRLKSPLLNGYPGVTVIPASEISRKSFYRKNLHQFETVFCFANVPPPVKLGHVRVFIFFQNLLLINSKFSISSGLITQLSLAAKRKYIQYKNEPSYKWLVQSKYVKCKLEDIILRKGQHAMVLPFFKQHLLSAQSRITSGNKRFLYIASGEHHKNHEYLFDVWLALANVHHNFPELHVTVSDEYPELNNKIRKHISDNGLKIVNHSNCTTSEIAELYSQCQYLVYPSLIESFGLPLIEAANSGCKVIAIDKPYVFEVLKPSAVFSGSDSNSLVEIIHNILANDLCIDPTEVLVTDKMDYLIEILLRGCS